MIGCVGIPSPTFRPSLSAIPQYRLSSVELKSTSGTLYLVRYNYNTDLKCFELIRISLHTYSSKPSVRGGRLYGQLFVFIAFLDPMPATT